MFFQNWRAQIPIFRVCDKHAWHLVAQKGAVHRGSPTSKHHTGRAFAPDTICVHFHPHTRQHSGLLDGYGLGSPLWGLLYTLRTLGNAWPRPGRTFCDPLEGRKSPCFHAETPLLLGKSKAFVLLKRAYSYLELLDL